MAFGLLTVGSGYGQFGFVGRNGIILADASTLTVNVSGATSQPIASPCVAGMVNSNTLLGISSPSTGGGNAFGFMLQNGTFSTFALPPSFVDTDSSYHFNVMNQDGNITDLWIGAYSTTGWNGGYPYLMNLSVIAGLTTGTAIVNTLGQYGWPYAPGGALVGNSILSSISSTLLEYNISTQTYAQYYLPSLSLSFSTFTVFGANFVYLDPSGNLYLVNTSGTLITKIPTTSFSTIATANPRLYNYLGTLMYVNTALNLACSINLNTGYVSPIFPFNINPNSGTVAYDSFDQQTGIMYLNTGGSSPNTFGNLTPMLLT